MFRHDPVFAHYLLKALQHTVPDNPDLELKKVVVRLPIYVTEFFDSVRQSMHSTASQADAYALALEWLCNEHSSPDILSERRKCEQIFAAFDRTNIPHVHVNALLTGFGCTTLPSRAFKNAALFYENLTEQHITTIKTLFSTTQAFLDGTCNLPFAIDCISHPKQLDVIGLMIDKLNIGLFQPRFDIVYIYSNENSKHNCITYLHAELAVDMHKSIHLYHPIGRLVGASKPLIEEITSLASASQLRSFAFLVGVDEFVRLSKGDYVLKRAGGVISGRAIELAELGDCHFV